MPLLTSVALPRIQPIVPILRDLPFNDPACLFEPKYDGFRGMVYLIGGGCTIYSKRGNRFSRFRELEDMLCTAIPRRDVILDGEVVAFDGDGRVMMSRVRRKKRDA
jgi:ATP-dependent DNA ligase